MANLINLKNHKYYQYSDGSNVEKKLLSFSKNSKLNFNNLSWHEYAHIFKGRAFFYEDLLSNFHAPNVLEVGCGCGAITKNIAKFCSNLDAVESSFIRSQITYNFCSEFDNVNIYSGLINDFSTQNNYDFIILNGVLEYSELFFANKDKIKNFAAQELIKKCLNLLAFNGKLLIAIENKFGLKYLMGTKEDHTGIEFDGINGYTFQGNNIKTYSYEDLLGFITTDYNLEIFIPFPDYKFPLAISRGGAKWDKRLAGLAYSFNKDQTLPYSCPNPWQNLAHYELARESYYGYLSNSFILSIGKDDKSIWDQKKLGIINGRSYSSNKIIFEENKKIFIVYDNHDPIEWYEGRSFDYIFSSIFRRSIQTSSDDLDKEILSLYLSLKSYLKENKFEGLIDLNFDNVISLENGEFKYIDLDLESKIEKNNSYYDPDILICRALINYLKVHQSALWNIKRKFLYKNLFFTMLKLLNKDVFNTINSLFLGFKLDFLIKENKSSKYNKLAEIIILSFSPYGFIPYFFKLKKLLKKLI